MARLRQPGVYRGQDKARADRVSNSQCLAKEAPLFPTLGLLAKSRMAASALIRFGPPIQVSQVLQKLLLVLPPKQTVYRMCAHTGSEPMKTPPKNGAKYNTVGIPGRKKNLRLTGQDPSVLSQIKLRTRLHRQARSCTPGTSSCSFLYSSGGRVGRKSIMKASHVTRGR